MTKRTRVAAIEHALLSAGLAVFMLALAGFAGPMPAMAAEKAIITGDRSWGDTNKRLVYFDGNVTIVQGSLRIVCQQAQIDADAKIGKLTGAVVLTDKGLTIKSDALDMDLQKKTGVFKGRVTLIRDEEKTQSAGKETVAKERVELSCDQLDGNTSKRSFVATGSVSLNHPDFTATCEKADFEEKTELLVMTGKVHLVRKAKNGEELNAGRVEVRMKDKAFTATESVDLSFEVEEQKSDEVNGAETAPDAQTGQTSQPAPPGTGDSTAKP